MKEKTQIKRKMDVLAKLIHSEEQEAMRQEYHDLNKRKQELEQEEKVARYKEKYLGRCFKFSSKENAWTTYNRIVRVSDDDGQLLGPELSYSKEIGRVTVIEESYFLPRECTREIPREQFNKETSDILSHMEAML
jgi:hypothetical protein